MCETSHIGVHYTQVSGARRYGKKLLLKNKLKELIMKNIVKIPLIVIGVFVAVIVSMAALKLCPPQGPWTMPPWCEGGIELPKTPTVTLPTIPQTQGGYKFTVTVPLNTPQHTVVFLEFPSASLRMNKKAANVWEINLAALPGKTYRYNRNNWGFVAAEEFSPDSKTTYRTIDKNRKEFNDTIMKWRWLPEAGYEMPKIPTKAGEIAFSPRINGERFQKGVLFVDFWWGNFADLLNSTHAKLKEDKVEWIEIAPPWDYKQVNPTPIITSEGFGHTYSDEEINLHLKKMKADGFKVFMSSQICCVSTDSASFSDEWWNAWFEQYENYVMYFVDLANKYDVEALVISGDQIALEKKPTNHKEKLEDIYSKAKQKYKGKLGRLFFLGGNINNIHELWPNPNDAPFMDRWDFFSINMWTGLTIKNNPTQEELYSNTKKIFDERLKPFYDSYKKPIVLQQVAYPSIDGGLKSEVGVDDPAIALWEPYSDKYTLDLEEQAMGFEAILKNAAETNYITGVYPFTYWPDDFPMTKEYNIRGKPAEKILMKWYSGIKD